MRLSARTQLTLWYVALLGTTLVLLGTVTYGLVWWMLRQETDEVLHTKAASIQEEVEVKRGRVIFEGLPRDHGLDIVRVWDPDGRPIHDLTTYNVPPLGAESLASVLRGGQLWQTIETDGPRIRLYTSPVRDRGRVIAAMQVGRSEELIEAVLADLRRAGGIIGAAALLLAWFGGQFIAGRALSPIDRIRRAAEQIGAHDLSRRLNLNRSDELGHLASAFDSMINRLEEAFEHERRFTADAAHELRTPLAVIRSQVEVALGRPRKAERDAQLLSSVQEDLERMGRLVDNLLALARADAGEALALVPVDMEEVVSDAAERAMPHARARDVRLAVHVLPANPVPGNAMWLGQLLSNLLENAIRHCNDRGQVALTLAPDSGGVALTVSDTGNGIAPEHLPHLFERFYRPDRARSRRSGGAGLGLAISAWVAKAHGGLLTAESRPGEGARFRLWLPTLPEPEPAVHAAAPGPASEPQFTPIA